MAHEQLKPFKKGDDPRRNTTGAQRKTITTLLKEMGENKSVSYHIILTDKGGVKKELKGTITGRGKNDTVNQLIAVQLLSKAIKGDMKAIQEVLDRTEGKPKQSIELDNLFAHGSLQVGYGEQQDIDGMSNED